jgi:S-sulfosulfanyl-L-cysteine sulfohydrolase
MQLSILFFIDVHRNVQPHPELFYNGGREIMKTVGGSGRIAGYIEQLRVQHNNVPVFEGGDTFHGMLPVVQKQRRNHHLHLNDLKIGVMPAFVRADLLTESIVENKATISI